MSVFPCICIVKVIWVGKKKIEFKLIYMYISFISTRDFGLIEVSVKMNKILNTVTWYFVFSLMKDYFFGWGENFLLGSHFFTFSFYFMIILFHWFGAIILSHIFSIFSTKEMGQYYGREFVIIFYCHSLLYLLLHRQIIATC